jgi:Glutamate synthase domain 3
MFIDASELNFKELNERVRAAKSDCEIIGCIGQRFIGEGLGGVTLTLRGTPGNTLGGYLNGANIEVLGSAQDEVGDTMNAGQIVVHGNIGDAVGYAMRGGVICVRGNAGYRAGIHMKAYKEKLPVLIIGGYTGSFLGEYQAGGVIIVLGLNGTNPRTGHIIGEFPSTGMHGGKLFLRGNCEGVEFPAQVNVRTANDADREELAGHLKLFCDSFGYNINEIIASDFTVVTPNTKNPYKQMYVQN